VYPALAVLQAIKDSADVLWIGGEGGMEAQLVSRSGIPFRTIPAAGVHGIGLRTLPGNLWQLSRGVFASRRILREFDPDVLFFTGGYVAVPMALRRWLPYAYFSDLSRFENLSLAYPLLFYRSTYPCSGKPRSDFAYDLVAADSPGIARPWAARILATALGRAERLLIAGGRRELAYCYRPWRSRDVLDGLLLRPRFINELLTNDEFLIDRLVGLGVAARELAAHSGVNARRTAKDLSIVLEGFNAAVNRKLRRVYGGQQAVSLGSLLMVEATSALAAALGSEATISATLHLSAQGCEQTFVNRHPRD